MFTSNPFADLTVFLSPLVMQVYIVLMILAVVIGTLFDMLHKSSAKFFARQWKKSKAAAERPVCGELLIMLRAEAGTGHVLAGQRDAVSGSE